MIIKLARQNAKINLQRMMLFLYHFAYTEALKLKETEKFKDEKIEDLTYTIILIILDELNTEE